MENYLAKLVMHRVLSDTIHRPTFTIIQQATCDFDFILFKKRGQNEENLFDSALQLPKWVRIPQTYHHT